MNVTHYFFRSSVNSGVIGGLVGIMVSGAANVKDYRKGKINATDMTKDFHENDNPQKYKFYFYNTLQLRIIYIMLNRMLKAQ